MRVLSVLYCDTTIELIGVVVRDRGQEAVRMHVLLRAGAPEIRERCLHRMRAVIGELAEDLRVRRAPPVVDHSSCTTTDAVLPSCGFQVSVRSPVLSRVASIGSMASESAFVNW